MNPRHILGISGGKDSAALAIYMKNKYPEMQIEYYNSDTGCELAETDLLISRLEAYLGGIKKLRAAEGSPEPPPFHHFLKAAGYYLPSPQARWCTQKMKLQEMEKFVGDTPAISYVGIRGDEDREGYVSTKPNIQAIFPFRENIWSQDVINTVFNNKALDQLIDLYEKLCPIEKAADIMPTVRRKIDMKNFPYSKKIRGLMNMDVKLFNHVIFEFLKTTDYPVGMLEEFPLIDNDEILVKDDIFRILEESGVGVPAYYNPIEFEVDGKKGTYSRSRSGCYFCFFQQKLEWVWLLEQHPDLFKKAMEFEKDGYTWNQNESLEELSKPERVRQIKLDAIAKQEKKKSITKNLVDMIDEDDDAFCANCFI